MRSFGMAVLTLLLAAVVAEGQCPTKEQFDACLAAAKKRYDEAALRLDKASACFNSRSCEYLKDALFCADRAECCTDPIKQALQALTKSLALKNCDAKDPCTSAAASTDTGVAAGCCPSAPGSLSTLRVCCQSADCSLCNRTVSKYVLDNKIVPSDVYVRLAATAVGTMCPNGTATNGYVCNKNCFAGAAGSKLASTNNDFVVHALESATVPYTLATCKDCCVLTFGMQDDLPCETGCRKTSTWQPTCHVCSQSSSSATGVRRQQPVPATKPMWGMGLGAYQLTPSAATARRCQGFSDTVSCAANGANSRCGGHACSRAMASFSWSFHSRVRVAVMAPASKMYTWKPGVSGWLILRYQIRFEKERRVCCPDLAGFGSDGLRCCGGDLQNGALCSGEEACVTPSGGPDGRCVADCNCPYGIGLNKSGATPGSVVMFGVTQQPCWVAAGLSQGSQCRMFGVTLAANASSLQFHSMTGFSSMRLLSDVMADTSTALKKPERSKAAVNRMHVGGAGLVIDVELAAEVKAGASYSLAGTTFTVFDDRHAALRSLMCPEAYELPLKASAMTMRSYLLPYAGGPNLTYPQHAAAADIVLVDACEAHSTCETCMAYAFNDALKCEWQPFARSCVTEGSSASGVLKAKTCGKEPPVLESTVGDINVFKFPLVLGIIPIVVLVLGTCAWEAWKLHANKEALRVHINFERALEDQEKAFTESRRGDARFLHQRKVPRKRDGQVEYVDEVMYRRLQDAKTPYHLMDASTLNKHFQKHGYSSLHY